MRIIRGKYKGFRINPPSHLPVRPTTDFAKTGLFNILEHRFHFSECNCVDMFSGTGSISLEFLSRGCKQLTSVDRERGCIDFLTKTATKLGFTNLTTFRTDVFVFLKKNTQKFDIAFADPPFKAAYKSDLIDKVLEVQLLSEEGVFILEHSTDEKFDDKPSFRFVRNYGNVAFSFFANFDLSSVSINDPS